MFSIRTVAMRCWDNVDCFSPPAIFLSPRKGSYRHSTMFLCQSVSVSGTKPIFGFTNYNILLFSTHYNVLGLLDDFATLLKFFCTFFAIFCKLAKTFFLTSLCYFLQLRIFFCNFCNLFCNFLQNFAISDQEQNQFLALRTTISYFFQLITTF